MNLPSPLDIVKEAHWEVSRERIASATATELRLAEWCVGLFAQLAGGEHRLGQIKLGGEE